MTVGLLYTHNIRRYLGRLAIFAVVSQPFWILAFNADDILGNLTNWNIFFTLLLSLLAMWGLTTRRWWLFVLCVLALAFGSFDYNYNGVILMLIFYLCRNKPGLGALILLPEPARPAGGAVHPVLAPRPVGRLPGGPPGPGGGRTRRQLDHLCPAGPAADPGADPLRP